MHIDPFLAMKREPFMDNGDRYESCIRALCNTAHIKARDERRESFSTELKKKETQALGGIFSQIDSYPHQVGDCVKGILHNLMFLMDSYGTEINNLSRQRTRTEEHRILRDYIDRITKKLDVANQCLARKQSRAKKRITSGDIAQIPGIFKLEIHPVQSAIYFLVRNDVVVYVGQSTCFQSRIATHIKESAKEFDSVFILPCNTELLLEWESALIGALSPEYNKQAGWCRSTEKSRAILEQIAAMGADIQKFLQTA